MVARHSPAPAGVGLPEREARTPKGPQGAERKHRFPTLYMLYTLYTAKTIPKTKTRGVSAAGRLANNSLQQWHIAKVSI